MVHLMIHLPDQVLLKGPVHFNWMYPMERQLGEYKKYVRNTRYPEGCIAEQYITVECKGNLRYDCELHILACQPEAYNYYSQCDVNGIKFVIWERDCKLKTQNSGVMVVADGVKFYGILENIVEPKYAEGMPVIVFRCKWFNTNPSERGSTRVDHGLLSVDTSTSWYDDKPYCLASTAKQVFYLDDPKEGNNWKVVNLVAPRGTYNVTSLSLDENILPIHEAYQEDTTQIILIDEEKYEDDETEDDYSDEDANEIVEDDDEEDEDDDEDEEDKIED
ncbi:hypothetical protein QQ045_008523 [Rhodiola kirilowii]